MKKILTLAILIGLLCQQLFAQPTQAEIDRMKAAKLEIEKMKKDPKNKELIKNMPDMDSLMKNIPKGTIYATSKNKKPDSTEFLFPLKNDKFLNALPIRTFTRAELVSYLHNLNSTLTELMRNRYGIDIKNIPDSAVTMTGTGIAFWIDGETGEGVLVALKGAELNTDNVTLLNNVGGMLTGCGLGVNAIPVLQYVLEKQPGNNMVLNNLGQAYLQLGDDKKAEQYLLQCVSTYSYYPDANLALAYIYNNRGNKSSSLKYAENSLRGAWSEGAYNLVIKLKPDAKLMDYIRHRYKQPEYFNFNKYPLLPQCRDTKFTPVLKPEYKAYKEMLAELQKNNAKLQRQEEEIARKTVPEKIKNDLNANKSPYRPFGIFANAVAANLWANEYYDRFSRFYEYKKNYLAEKEKLIADCLAKQKEITAQHKSQKDAVAERDGEGSDGSEYDKLNEAICAEKELVRNRYLNLIADVTEAFQQKAIHLYKDYFNDMAFWFYVGSVDDHQYKAEFYGLVLQFLDLLADINTTHFYTPCQPLDDGEGKIKDIEPIEEPDCFIPGKIELPLGALALKLDCQSYKIEAGEGLVGSIEYKRSSGDFTMAFGVGAKVPRVLFKTPGLKSELVGEVKSQLYITFDKQGNPTDLGILWESELKLKAAFGEEEVKYSIGMKEKLTAGFGTGVQMGEGGQLKAFIDKTFPVQPDAKQINKNVPLYKK